MSPRAPRTGAHISASSFAEPRALTSDEWVEPRSPREQDLQVRLLRTQKELHRARSELARRTEAHAERQKKDSTGKAEEGKPDWTLALRYRLTAELRAEMNRLETGWAADKRSYTKTLTELQSKFERTKTEKEAMISRLLKEVLELQRLYARANAQREMFHVIDSTEIRNAERERETHVEMLTEQLERFKSGSASEHAKLVGEVGRLSAALAGVSEDLEAEREKKRQQKATMSMEIEKLRADVANLTEELAQSQSLHQQDTAELRREKSSLEVELASHRSDMTKQYAVLASEKEREVRELSTALKLLKVQKDKTEAALKADIEHKELQRKAETSALTARVKHMRELQQHALAHVKGEARKMFYVAENVAVLSDMDPDVRRRMGIGPPEAGMPEGEGFDADKANQALTATKWMAAVGNKAAAAAATPA